MPGATAWHLIRLGSLALSGAGLLCTEATAVEAEGRITAADLGTHGYLVHEFMSPIANPHTDKFGGTLENRNQLTVR